VSGSGNEARVVFDREDLLKTVDGETEIMEELVGMFLTAVPEQMESIKAAIEQTDFSEAARHAHRLKGTAANLRAEALYLAYTQLEKALKEGNLPQAMAFLDVCSDGFGRFREVIEHGA
jgi:HPt (histidine-containing phosphotransfer) domain-containing protein